MNKTCADCIRYEVCEAVWETYGISKVCPSQCGCFKDKSRFIDLPCAVDDVVYTYKREWRKEDGIVPYQITNITITQNKKGIWTKKYRAMQLINGKTIDWQVNFSFDELGKTVFLTKEDAEKALKGGAE